MKSKPIVFFLLLLASLHLFGQEEDCRQRNWIIPRYLNLQYSGGIGTYVIGAGYTLNKSQSLRLVFLYGFTPESKANLYLHNLSFKFTYHPVWIKVYKDFSLSPTTSLGASYIFADGPGTFAKLPSYYPDDYYAPNAFRAHFSLGGVGRYDLDEKYFVRAIELYIETTTNDLYVKYFIKYDALKLTDIFSMAIGVNILMGRK